MSAIRLARPNDLKDIVELINLAYIVEAHFVSGPRILPDGVASRIAAGEMLLLRGDDNLVATAHLRLAHDGAHLGLVSVHPDMQGLGIGRRIVVFAEEAAAERGARHMRLQVVNLREELSGFYQSMGYRKTGTSAFDETKSTLKPVHFIDMVKDLVKADG